jgi:hypothetical protein
MTTLVPGTKVVINIFFLKIKICYTELYIFYAFKKAGKGIGKIFVY